MPGALAGRVHHAAVRLDDVAHNRQPEPEAAMAPGARPIGLPESVEDERQRHGIYPAARISNLDDDLLGVGPDSRVNGPAAVGELDRVRQQVPEHLL